MTQNEQILTALKRGPLTPMEALHQYGVFRLAARIGELREMGHTIVSESWQTATGKKVARYRLVSK